MFSKTAIAILFNLLQASSSSSIRALFCCIIYVFSQCFKPLFYVQPNLVAALLQKLIISWHRSCNVWSQSTVTRICRRSVVPTSGDVVPDDSVGRPSTLLGTVGCGAGAGLQQVQILLIFSHRILYQGTSLSFLVFSSLVPKKKPTEKYLLEISQHRGTVQIIAQKSCR